MEVPPQSLYWTWVWNVQVPVSTATWGEEESAVRLPEAVDFSAVEKGAVPLLAGGVTALAPPPEP
jgi:hypothetical protein